MVADFILLSVCVISFFRLTSLLDVSFTDLTYTVTDGLIWSLLEPTLGLVSACLPTMRPLFGKLFPERFLNRTKANNSSKGGMDHRSFDRLDEQGYSLVVVNGGAVDPSRRKDSKAAAVSSVRTMDDIETQSHPIEPNGGGPLGGITVKKAWNISH